MLEGHEGLNLMRCLALLDPLDATAQRGSSVVCGGQRQNRRTIGFSLFSVDGMHIFRRRRPSPLRQAQEYIVDRNLCTRRALTSHRSSGEGVFRKVYGCVLENHKNHAHIH